MNISFAVIEDFRTNIGMYIGIYMHSFNIFVKDLTDAGILHLLVSFNDLNINGLILWKLIT